MRHRFIRGLAFVALAALAVALVGFIVMQLWNSLLPGLFGWKLLGFWQAVGLLVLARILFGGLRGRGGWHGHWRARMRERWERMTPEEREKFRAGLGWRCGGRRGGADESRTA
jgi:hypothetical protein